MQQEKWCSGQTHSVTGSGGTCSFLKSGRAEQRGSHDAPLPAANIWDCRLAPLVVQARMPSAAFPSWPAGGELSYSWNFCFHVPARGEPGPCAPGRARPGAASSLAGAQRRPGCGPVPATTFQRQLLGGTGPCWCSCASRGHLPVPSTGWCGAGGSAPLCCAAPLCHAAHPGTAAVWICNPTITATWKQACERGVNVPKSLSLRCVGWDPGLGVMCAGHVLCPHLPRGAEPRAVCVLAEKEEIDHPNNSFSPCSIHDRKCLQKQQAKRVNNGNKMRNSGSPYHREETRPIVSAAGSWGGGHRVGTGHSEPRVGVQGAREA